MKNIMMQYCGLMAIGAIMGCFIAGCSAGKGAAQNSSQIPSRNQRWLEQKGSPTNLVYLSVSEESLGRLIKAEASNQPIFETGILAGNGNAFAVYQKTPVEVLENKGTCMKVRLLDGQWKGRIGWIQSEFVKSRNASL